MTQFKFFIKSASHQPTDETPLCSFWWRTIIHSVPGSEAAVYYSFKMAAVIARCQVSAICSKQAMY